MRIYPHIIPRGRILKNIVKTDDMFSGVNIYDDIKEQLKSHLNITNIYDLVNPYEIRRAIIANIDKPATAVTDAYSIVAMLLPIAIMLPSAIADLSSKPVR